MSAHFQIYSPLPVAAAPGSPVRTIRWRLVASNSRALAVSADAYPDFASAQLDVERFVDLHTRAQARFTSGVDDRWDWSLLVEGRPMARSVRSYIRRLECEQSVNHVYRLTPSARRPVVLWIFGQHRGRQVDPAAVDARGEHAADTDLLAVDLPVRSGVAPKVVPLARRGSREPFGSVTRSLRAPTR